MIICFYLLFLLLNFVGNRGFAGRVGEKGYYDKKVLRKIIKMVGNVK